MIELLLSILAAILCGYVAHELVLWGNRTFPELNFMPNLCGVICIFFGLTGMACLGLLAAIKILIKRMIKR